MAKKNIMPVFILFLLFFFITDIFAQTSYIEAYIQVKSQKIKAGDAAIFTLVVQPPNAVHKEVIWNFGDGETKYFGEGVSGSRSVRHVYKSPGDYNVSVNFVKWDGKLVAISPVKITVLPAAAPAGLYIEAYIQVKSQNIKVGDPAIFTLVVQPPNAVHKEVIWNFGDGETKYFGEGVSGSRSVRHVYKSPGDYNVSVNFVKWDGKLVAISPVKITVLPATAPERIIDQRCAKYYTKYAKEYDANKDGKLDSKEFLNAFRDRKNLIWSNGYWRPKFSLFTLKKMQIMMRLKCDV